VTPDEYGEWVRAQDPLTGEIVRAWKPWEVTPDDANTPDVNEQTLLEIPCIARGIVDGGIRVAGTTEWFGSKNYQSIDYAKMWVPPNINITKRDRITNIKGPDGRIMWRNEEFESQTPNHDGQTTVLPTLFNVNGVTPLFDAFNRPVEQFVLLQNAEIQEPVDA
jgi:hypothetical protein